VETALENSSCKFRSGAMVKPQGHWERKWEKSFSSHIFVKSGSIIYVWYLGKGATVGYLRHAV